MAVHGDNYWLSQIAGLLAGGVSNPVARGLLGQGLAPIAARAARFDLSGIGDGTNLTTNSKILYVPYRDSYVTRVAYYNSSLVTINVSASREQTKQITFNNGATSVAILPKQWAVSDPIPGKVSKGSSLYIYTFMSITSGAYHQTHTISETGEQGEKGVALADKTMGGTITNSGGGTFGPVALLYQLADDTPVVTGLGDSIMGGVGDPASKSFVYRALENKKSFFLAQRSGETAQAFVLATDVGSIATSDPLTTSNSRYMLAEAGNWVLGNYAINDLRLFRAATLVQADLISIWRALDSEGIKVTWCTAMPNSSSTDSWATLANQSVNASIIAQRAILNAWMRAGAPLDPSTFAAVAVGTAGALVAGQSGHPLYKIFDVSVAVEDGVDSGKWKSPGYTTDGIHPTALGHTDAAAIITAAMDADTRLFK